MACKEETTEINGRTYYVVQMSPEKAIPVQLKLVKVFSGSLTILAGAMRGNFQGQAEALGEAISKMFENSSEEEIFALLKQVTETAKCDGKRISFGETFSGDHLVDCYKVFFWVVGVNFSSFFGERGLNGFLQKFQAMVTETIKRNAQKGPPQTSTPISGNPSTPDSANSENSKTVPIQ